MIAEAPREKSNWSHWFQENRSGLLPLLQATGNFYPDYSYEAAVQLLLIVDRLRSQFTYSNSDPWQM